MNPSETFIRECVNRGGSRLELWARFLNSVDVRHMVEIGVYRGDFASQILKQCDSIQKYYMIDPWRHLDHWNKPANDTDGNFEGFLAETLSKTEFAVKKRIILRGETTEVVDGIPDGELDFAYIDGDHTLRGIAIDLIRIFPKIKMGGWIGGDDFSATIWQHPSAFEPTLVFPYAVHFAEAVGARIFSLPNSQFLIEKNSANCFAFVDLVGGYSDTSVGNQLRPLRVVKLKVAETFPILTTLAGTFNRMRHARGQRVKAHRFGG